MNKVGENIQFFLSVSKYTLIKFQKQPGLGFCLKTFYSGPEDRFSCYLSTNSFTNPIGISITSWIVIAMSAHSDLDCPLNRLAKCITNRTKHKLNQLRERKIQIVLQVSG